MVRTEPRHALEYRWIGSRYNSRQLSHLQQPRQISQNCCHYFCARTDSASNGSRPVAVNEFLGSHNQKSPLPKRLLTYLIQPQSSPRPPRPYANAILRAAPAMPLTVRKYRNNSLAFTPSLSASSSARPQRLRTFGSGSDVVRSISSFSGWVPWRIVTPQIAAALRVF